MSQSYYYILTWAALTNNPLPLLSFIMYIIIFYSFISKCDNMKEWWKSMKTMFIVWNAAYQLEVFSVWKIMVQEKGVRVDSCLYTDFFGRVI